MNARHYLIPACCLLLAVSLPSCNIFDATDDTDIITCYFLRLPEEPHSHIYGIRVENFPELFVGDTLSIYVFLTDNLNSTYFSYYWRAPNRNGVPYTKTNKPFLQVKAPNKSGYFWVSLYVENDSTQSKSDEFVFGIPVRQD